MAGLPLRFLFLIILIAGAANAAVPAPDANEILRQSAQSIKNLNYQARVTFEHSGMMEVVDITHVVSNNAVIEQVQYLNGPERSVLTSRPLDCDGVGSLMFGGQFVSGLNGEASSLAKSYHLNVIGVERVAGRDSWVLHMQPKDQYRHSIILAVDAETFLPTRILTMSKARKVLERTHMVSINASLDEDKISELASLPIGEENKIESCDEVAAESPLISTKPEWVPPGFVLASSESTVRDGIVETYTDGVAVFTVVAKPLSSENSRAMSTRYTQGATVVVMRVIESDDRRTHVSVLGEIPVDTATKILASVRLQ